MIAKLVRIHSNAQQNMEQTQNTTMGVTINNESTTTEPPPGNGPNHRGGGGGGLNAFYCHQFSALDSVVVKTQKVLNSHGSFLTIAMYHHRETV